MQANPPPQSPRDVTKVTDTSLWLCVGSENTSKHVEAPAKYLFQQANVKTFFLQEVVHRELNVPVYFFFWFLDYDSLSDAAPLSA